jgi:hypothetical protein
MGNDDNRLFCKAFVGLLGSYSFSDQTADGKPLLTIYFPQDTLNDYPDYTLVHELTHRDLTEGSLVGNLQLLLANSDSLIDCPSENRERMRRIFAISAERTRLAGC